VTQGELQEPVSTPPPRLIVGLGNPGNAYKDTRHNIGFMVLDALAASLGATFAPEKRWECHLARTPDLWLVKPQTYMNLSGRAVRLVSKFFRLPPSEILAVHDDVDLPLGRLRLRAGGSAGGHNGIKSMIAELGTSDFPRLKLGVTAGQGRPDGGRLVGHVLGPFTADEKAAVAQVIDQAVTAIRRALSRGLEAAMNEFNTRPRALQQPRRENTEIPNNPTTTSQT
jgi:PTH1 family peptidyl-tRNA hydrolase